MKALLILPISLFMGIIAYYNPDLFNSYSVATRLLLFVLFNAVVVWCVLAGLKMAVYLAHRLLNPGESQNDHENHVSGSVKAEQWKLPRHHESVLKP